MSRSKGDPPGGHRLLHDGARMSQPEFHQAYAAMPEGYRAELIAGVVCEPSPVGLAHGDTHSDLGLIITYYATNTPGLRVAHDATVILSKIDEVQPDISLRIVPSYGGQCTYANGKYIKGAPELVAEIADGSRFRDLSIKKERYTKAGVQEYIVVGVDPWQFFWFSLPTNQEFSPDNNGIYRSKMFPGLCIDANVLLQHTGDEPSGDLLAALTQGMQTEEYKVFRAELAAAKNTG